MRGKRNKHRRKTGSEKRKTTAELEMFSSRYQFRAGVPVVLTRFYSALSWKNLTYRYFPIVLTLLLNMFI